MVSRPFENELISATGLPRKKMAVKIQIVWFVSPGAILLQNLAILNVQQLGAAIRAEIERLVEIEPHLMFATQWGQCDAVEVVRKLPRVVLHTLRRGTE